MINLKKYISLYLKGIAMGCCDVVPGVSGSTIALISGIYPEFIDAITRFNLSALKVLFSKGIIAAWKQVNAKFLVPVLAGIGTAIIVFSNYLYYLLKHFPLSTWAFFFGLILASIVILSRQLSVWKLKHIVFAAIGLALGVYLSFIENNSGSSIENFSLFYIFICGALAIIAMLLPGISGAFILVLLGSYEFILQALHQWNITVITVFILGAVMGILSFSRIIKWCLHYYHDISLAFLTGIIAGALVKVFPWGQASNAGSLLDLYTIPLAIIVLSFISVIMLDRISRKISD